MASLGVESLNSKKMKKAMWLYPKALGFNPPERWGHSACCLDGVLYVFGGCCGGLHFSDVLRLDLETMTWATLATGGQKPGTRDSHSTVLVGQKMVVLGGTNGAKKVNDIHMLDLKTKEWSRPHCFGTPPSPRESHTATVVGDERLVVFGGSGEGGGNYLNDVHILDLKTMTWNSPVVKGVLPAPRDSHTAVAIGNHQILVYGGDCGDRYYGEVDVLDVDTLTWSRLDVRGSTPGVRAGHSAISVGTKVYIIGGVGDKHYYSDVWILDINTCSWSQLEVCEPRPQGRFSHTAVVSDTDVIVYGGCGEDERPLNELLVLQLNNGHRRNDISMCKVFGNNWGQYKHKFINNSKISRRREADQIGHELDEESKKKPHLWELDDKSVNRRRSGDERSLEVESEQEEHSLSLSHNSSASQSDQEQTNFKKTTTTIHQRSILQPQRFGQLKLLHRDPSNCKRNVHIETTRSDFNSIQRESSRPPLKTEQFLRVMHPGKPEAAAPFLAVDDHKAKSPNRPAPGPPLPPPSPSAVPPHMGSEVRGMVDGAFDSGYLITANVNGQIFRGVLFAPAPTTVSVMRSAIPPRAQSSPLLTHSQPPPPPLPPPAMADPIPLHHVRPLPHQYALHDSGHSTALQTKPAPTGESHKPSMVAKGDLQGVVLTLGGPGGGD